MPIDRKDICGIVVTYNPDSSVVDNVRALLGQVDQVVVVDNGSAEMSQPYLTSLRQMQSVKMQCNRVNLGIAAALNIGVKIAIQDGYPWIATFDQDSTITAGMFAAMSEAYDECPSHDEVAIICPRYRDRSSGYEMTVPHKRMISERGAKVFSTMTSGSLVQRAIFEGLGLFVEELFIDHVDFEFCLRCNRHGYFILEAQQAVLDHSVGDPTIIQALG